MITRRLLAFSLWVIKRGEKRTSKLKLIMVCYALDNTHDGKISVYIVDFYCFNFCFSFKNGMHTSCMGLYGNPSKFHCY